MGQIYFLKIGELRRRKNLTQKEFADLVGVDISTVRNWEQQRGGVETFVRVANVCRVLECQPDDLFEIQEI